ncbi:EAL domain-containing protein [Alteromonadaceae bacterium BrNp21-10]|nr:EAL domain-containing protein [Alteromonadaceae bacterium BrNp21-10]
MSKNILFRKHVAENIRTALQQDEFKLKFMPIYHAKTLSMHGVEVLLRCTSKSLEGIGPDIFIPIAEEFGIIKDIDMWVIEATFKTIDANSSFLEQHNLVFGINISAVELHN